MIRLTIANQRGGVAKTTTCHSLARYFADQGLKVLIIDADPQGSVSSVLKVPKAESYLHQFVIMGYNLQNCVVQAHENIDLLCSNRDTVETEAMLMGRPGREMTFKLAFSPADQGYDVVLVDVAPSISLLQSCAMVYTEQILIPVSMDSLSLQGAGAALQAAAELNSYLRADIKPIAFLPVMVDRRFQITQTIMQSLERMAEARGVSILPPIRTDGSVAKASRLKAFLADHDPKCKAVEDYARAGEQLLQLLKGQLDGRQLTATAGAETAEIITAG